MGRAKVHPRKAVLTSIQVPPVSIRPALTNPGMRGTTSADTTTLLAHLINLDKRIEEINEANMEEQRSYIEELQVIYYSLIHGTSGSDGKKKGISTSGRGGPGPLAAAPEEGGAYSVQLAGEAYYVHRSQYHRQQLQRTDQRGVCSFLYGKNPYHR